MAFPKRLKDLCTPAFLYFAISIFWLLVMVIQNVNSDIHTLWIGQQNIRVPNLILVFFIQIIYILFWTWILNLMCRDGHSDISWLLVLVPFLIMFIGIVFSV
jgi:hypothetical protein